MKNLTGVTGQIVRNFIISILLHCSIIMAMYFIVQPDPKGIAIGGCLIVYSWMMSVSGIIVLIFNSPPQRILYLFVMVGNLIHVWWLTQIDLTDKALNFNFFHALLVAGVAICIILWLNFVQTIFGRERNAS